MKSLNLNEYVYVKLTDFGRNIAANDDVWEFNRVEDGWTRVQLWELMKTFGEFLYNGAQVPFETTIGFQDDSIKDVE